MEREHGKGSTASRTVKVLVVGTVVAAVVMSFCGIVCTATETELLMSDHR